MHEFYSARRLDEAGCAPAVSEIPRVAYVFA